MKLSISVCVKMYCSSDTSFFSGIEKAVIHCSDNGMQVIVRVFLR